MLAHPVFRLLLVLTLEWFLCHHGGLVRAQAGGDRVADPCISKETCGACIQTAGCQWCSKTIGVENSTVAFRCTSTVSAHSSWCPDHVVNPQPSSEKKMDLNLGSSVQIKPQHVKLRLRVDQTYDLNLQYAQAEDYPVDLYYLMDLSASMADDKDNLSNLGNILADAMRELTKNFRLGFGSFVDKVTLPYVSTVPSKLKEPCTIGLTKKKCAPAYSFKNHMPLSNSTELFQSSVQNAPVSGNLDAPEGGFDALMQAIVCQQHIGWREQARHLIIFSTDAQFHIAGDGKLGGVVVPNDELCHMNDQQEYPQSFALEYDYPSISQINQKAKEHNMNLIFAVTQNQEGLYQKLVDDDRIEGASCGVLDHNSLNVVKLVKDQYEKLKSSVELSDNARADVLEVRYFSSCLNGTEKKPVKFCDGLRVNQEIDFTAQIRVVACPKNESMRTQRFEIKPIGINESLVVEVEIICDCPCERPDSPNIELNSLSCSGSGTLQCGVCKCNPGYVGRKCECKGDSLDDTSSQDTCKVDPTQSEVCSGRGSCKCGVCQCKTRDNPSESIYGNLCECDNFSCKRSGKMVCSGPTHGTCDCGRCKCHAGWTGEKCECRDANNTCILRGQVCSGNGDCVCGACECKKDSTGKLRFSGTYCEECAACPGQRCDELRSCVECGANLPEHSTNLVQCSSQCFNLGLNKVQLVDRITEENESNGEHVCRRPDNSGCTFIFMYKYIDKELYVEAQRTKECGSNVNILGLVLGVTGSTVIIGLLLLVIWKIITSIHDKREYAKFEKERALSKWDRGDNPLYKPSTSTFSNPTFGGQ